MSQTDPDRSPNSLDESPSWAVVEALAAAEGVAPHTLEPILYDAVDPDALDALFAPRPDGTERGTGQASFVVGGYAATVDTTGTVTLSSDS